MEGLSAPTPRRILRWTSGKGGKKNRAREEKEEGVRVLKNPSLMTAQERSGRKQTKVSKTSKEVFLKHGSLFLLAPLFPPLSKHVFTNCRAVSCPSQALHSSQVYSAGGGGLLQQESLITRPSGTKEPAGRPRSPGTNE